MNFLLDTATLIWVISWPERLSRQALKLVENPAHRLFLSSISIWEIHQKTQKEPIFNETLPLRDFLNKALTIHDIEVLGFDLKSAQTFEELPPIHADPFDRMIICQAMAYSLPVITPDKIFNKYPVEVVW